MVVERPGYDPLIGAARLLGARAVSGSTVPWKRAAALDPDRVRAALTPRTRLDDPDEPAQSDERADSSRDPEGDWQDSRGRRRPRARRRGLSRCRERTGARSSRGARRSLDLHEQPHEIVRALQPALRLGDRRTAPRWNAFGAPATSSTAAAPSSAERLAMLAFSQIDRLMARATALARREPPPAAGIPGGIARARVRRSRAAERWSSPASRAYRRHPVRGAAAGGVRDRRRAGPLLRSAGALPSRHRRRRRARYRRRPHGDPRGTRRARVRLTSAVRSALGPALALSSAASRSAGVLRIPEREGPRAGPPSRH